ncbi:sugar phosphate nucleotidyltransferase, partial [bacterium]|nr:sugar phosphate nucleotidyltransferase [bacterium]
TAVYPPARFGALDLDSSGSVMGFIEKPLGDNGFINGGFGVFNTSILNLVNEDSGPFEKSILEHLAKENDLNAFIHKGFWHAMDTLRDKKLLNDLIADGAPWIKRNR